MENRTGTARLVEVIEDTWAAIRDRTPDVPEVLVTIASGSDGQRGGLTLGHFAPSRWVREDESSVHELFVGGEGLALGAESVLATLLHEAAHGVARYQALAEEVGIVVEHSPTLGYSNTSLPATTAVLYAAQLDELAGAITAYRRAEVALPAGGAGGRTSNNNGSALVCGCGRKIRAAISVAAAGPILCGLCGEAFEAEQDDADGEDA